MVYSLKNFFALLQNVIWAFFNPFSFFSNSDDGGDDGIDGDRNYELLLACCVLHNMLKNILLDYMRQKLICPDFINGMF